MQTRTIVNKTTVTYQDKAGNEYKVVAEHNVGEREEQKSKPSGESYFAPDVPITV